MTYRGVGRIFKNIVLFFVLDVEHSCLPASLDDLESRENLDSVQISYIKLLKFLQLLELEGLCSNWGQVLRLDREIP